MIALAITIIVEIIQPIAGRSFDIDDVIMNFIGVIVGYIVGVVIKSFIRGNNKL